MSLPQWILSASFVVFACAGVVTVLTALASRGAKDPSEPRGSAPRAVVYSLTGAMFPAKKESASRHAPTYVAGLVFHAGVFVSLAWLVIHFFHIAAPSFAAAASRFFLVVSSAVGLGLFVKRIVKPSLRSLSTPDDYASNLLVAGFQAITAASLFTPDLVAASFIWASVLLLYIPLGKLRHAVYFVLTRTYLGFFYGKRGVWGAKRKKEWEAQNR